VMEMEEVGSATSIVDGRREFRIENAELRKGKMKIVGEIV